MLLSSTWKCPWNGDLTQQGHFGPGHTPCDLLALTAGVQLVSTLWAWSSDFSKVTLALAIHLVEGLWTFIPWLNTASVIPYSTGNFTSCVNPDKGGFRVLIFTTASSRNLSYVHVIPCIKICFWQVQYDIVGWQRLEQKYSHVNALCCTNTLIKVDDPLGEGKSEKFEGKSLISHILAECRLYSLLKL